MWEKLQQLLKMNPILFGFGSFAKSLISRWTLVLGNTKGKTWIRFYFRPIVLIILSLLCFYLTKTCQNKKTEKRQAAIANLTAQNKALVQEFANSKRIEASLKDSIVQLQNQYVNEIIHIDAIPEPRLQRSVDSVVAKYFNRYYLGEFETSKPKY